MSSSQGRGRGGGRGGERGGQRGGQRGGRGGGQADRGGRGDFGSSRGGRGDGGFRGGRGDGGRGDGRGGVRGDRGFRGGRGQGTQMAIRGPLPGRPGIFLSDTNPDDPDPAITAAEDALVKQTMGKMIDGFPGRSGYGTKGRKIVLRTNYFKLTTAFEAKQSEVALYKYDVEVRQELSKPKTRRLFDVLLTHPVFNGINWATDYAKTLITTKEIDLKMLMDGKESKKVTLPPEDGNGQPQQASGPAPDFVRQARDRNTFEVRITHQTSYALRDIIQYLQSSSAGATYAGRTDVLQVLNIIMAKAPNSANNVRKVGQNNFYPYGNHPGREFYDLGNGLEALRGYYASVRPAVNRLLVNLNVTSGAFFKSMPLIALMNEFRGNLEQREAFLRMLKVNADYIKDGESKPFMSKTKTIVGFAKATGKSGVKRFGNANEVKFSYLDRAMPNAQTRHVTVAAYFRQHHGITLKQATLPVLNVGTRADPQYLPPELCHVLPGQPYRRLLSGDQTTEMLRFAARAPNLNAMSIAGTASAPGNGLRLFRLSAPQGEPSPQANSIQPFGFRVGTSMISVPGRILDTPTVKYGPGGKDVVPRGGSWNCAAQKFVKPGRFQRWQVLIINRQGPRGNALSEDPQGEMLGPEPLVKKLEGFLKDYGISMGSRGPTQRITLDQLTLQNRPSNDRALRQAFGKAEDDKVDMLFVILPEVDRWLYARIKYFGDIEYGIGSICSVGNKLQKPGGGQGMYMGNLALKFNLKGGGVSHTVPNTAVKPIDNNTMLVGIDVTHPSPGSTGGAPSIACIVASTDSSMFQWPGSIRRQQGRAEMVADLHEMVDERLVLWQKKNGRLPTKIVIYRDGVSEGQYELVLRHELPSFERAFEKRYGAKEKWPKVAIIIVGKRHHTRFYPTREQDADYNPGTGKGSCNPLPGTVVDRGIANKILREFWLQAHQGLQGTARPAHYVVIKDEISFSADELEQFTHHLCYHFNRATKAVSICPPAYYADLLCERGRAYLFETLAENHVSDSSVFNEDNEWSRNVHPRLQETTWYV